MIARLRSSLTAAVLTVAILATQAVPIADARAPRATRYHAGGPITLDTNLLSKSGASAWAINEYLRANTPLPALGAAFIKAEKKYGVNARFLLAAALHESGWGSSYISRTRHNLFGYNAYDRDPVRYASAFDSYAAGIDATARFIRESYLTPGGRWWGGQPTLRSMQRYWSSSGTWGVGVSRIASSIHLRHIARRSIHMAAPTIGGDLHRGSRTQVRLTWKGGSIPKAIEFVARWVPVQLDSAGADATAGATTVVAKRVRTGSRSIVLAVTAPREPGRYRLSVSMRDIGRLPLPAADRVGIPSIAVRVWADRAVSYELVPGTDGAATAVRITNTGRETIPAAPDEVPSEPRDPEAAPARSIVSVTASAGEAGNPDAVQLVAAPLHADLAPGASISIRIPGTSTATGRATTWLAVNLSVLGDPGWLAGTATFGAWVSDTTAGPVAGAAAPAEVPAASPAPTASPRPTAAATPGPSARPTPTPSARPTPTPRATPTPTPTPTPRPTAKATPKPTAKPAPTKVTRTYSEHSSAIRYRGGWGTAPNSRYLGGRVAWSKSPGATATFTFTGSSVTWVGPKGPTRGKALVILDGRVVARVDMGRTTFVARTVLFKRSFHGSRRHTLTIKVLSTPGRPCVAIDGFIVRS